jgi:hypothetical protein
METEKIIFCDSHDIFNYKSELEMFFNSIFEMDYLDIAVLTNDSSIRDFTFLYPSGVYKKECNTLNEEYDNWDSWFIEKITKVYNDRISVNMNDTLIILMEKIRRTQNDQFN